MTHEYHLKHYPFALDGIPSAWAVGSVRLLCGEPQSGFACGRHNSQGRGVVHLRPMNVSSTGEISLESVKYVEPEKDLRVEEGDVLFNNTNSPAWVGKTAPILKPDDWAFSNHMTRLRPHSEIDHRYLAGQLQFLQACGYFRHLCVNHVNQASINGEVLSDSVPILVPPSNEQTRIADRIDELFTDLAAGVAALERVRMKLKRYRSAVLQAAVTGRLTEAWRQEHGPPAESGEQLLERLLLERRRQWEERTLADYEAKGATPPKNWRQRYQEPVAPKTEDLPELPEDWCWASVDQLLLEGLCSGISVKGQENPPGVMALKLNAMTDRGFDYSEVRYIPIDAATANANSVQEGDFFVSRGNGSRRLLARGTVAQSPPELTVFPDTMIRFRLASEATVLPVVWPSPLVRAQIEKKAKTTAGIYKVNQADLSSIVVPLPPTDEQIQLADALELKASLIEAMEAEVERGLARAARLRQAILKAAFAGKLVPQDPSDEPAAVLLDRIRTEREALAAQSDGRPKRATRTKAAPTKKAAKSAARKSTKKQAGRA